MSDQPAIEVKKRGRPKGSVSRIPEESGRQLVAGTIGKHQVPDKCLLINFKRHEKILERIKQRAKEELRTPENQVIYWLMTLGKE